MREMLLESAKNLDALLGFLMAVDVKLFKVKYFFMYSKVIENEITVNLDFNDEYFEQRMTRQILDNRPVEKSVRHIQIQQGDTSFPFVKENRQILQDSNAYIRVVVDHEPYVY
jgi:hypothetical protein